VRSNQIHLWLADHGNISTEAFLREVLSHYLPLSPAKIRFARTHNGKPYLKDRRFEQLQFNVSHSHGKIVCAVSLCQLIGVDIENIHRKNSLDEIAQRYFHADEIRALQSITDEAQRRQLFFKLWTCKEAYIKAIGKTIGTASLDKIGFNCEGESIQALFPRPVQQQWFFQALSLQETMIAVARAQRPWQSGTPPELTIYPV
jgi:4'-phosphopantetheinyl transferase